MPQPDVPSTQQLRRPPGLPEPDAVAPLQLGVTQPGAGVSSGTGTVAVTQGVTDNLGERDAGAGSLQAGQGDVTGNQGGQSLAGRLGVTEERDLRPTRTEPDRGLMEMLPENYDGQRNRQTSFHSAGSGGSMQATIQRLRRELEQTRQTLDSLKVVQSPPMTYGVGDDPIRTPLADPIRTPLAQPLSPPPQPKDSYSHT